MAQSSQAWPRHGSLPLQSLTRLGVLLRSMPTFNLGDATCDRGAQDEQIGLACVIAPATLNYLSIWARKQGVKKGGEWKEGGGWGPCGAVEHLEELLCLGSWRRQTASPYPLQRQAALFRLPAFTDHILLCLGESRLVCLFKGCRIFLRLVQTQETSFILPFTIWPCLLGFI